MIARPILLDALIQEAKDSAVEVEINGKWYVAKDLRLLGFHELRVRAYHAWLVLTGRARAYQFAEDQMPGTSRRYCMWR